MNAVIRRSPLNDLKKGLPLAENHCRNLLIQERKLSGKILLRIHGSEQAASSSLQQALDISLPLVPNTTSDGGPLVIWLGCSRWMIVCEDTEVEQLSQRIRHALTSTVCIVAECSDSRIVFRISGKHTRALMEKCCALDLHPDRFSPGRCSQTLFARIPALIHQIDTSPSFDLYVDTSLAVYAWRYLVDASSEFLRPPEAPAILGTGS